MEAHKTMRNTMALVLSMAAAACGTVQPASVKIDDGDEMEPGMDAGTGSGSGAGSGEGSGSGAGSGSGEVDTGCNAASDCASGEACEMSTHQCIAGMISIELQSSYIDDGTRWWTSTSAPVVRGTFSGPSFAAIKVKVGTTETAATLQGNTWSAQLPQGAIKSTETPVTVVMTDPSGGSFEVAQMFVLDGAGPVITVEPSTVKDERGDTIDFSKGEPFHTHAGATIDLAAAGCPSVYKYSYLMDATIPYGVNVTPNPLAWRVKISDMKLAAGSQFSVRSEDGSFNTFWSPVPAPDANGISTLVLTRTGGTMAVSALGSRTGKFYIDVKARDWSNNETVKSICFDHHPLQAPVAAGALGKSSLFDVNLPGNTETAFMLNAGGSVDVASQTITQQTAEPTTLTWTVGSTPFSYTKATYDGIAVWTSEEQVYCLNGVTDPKCATTWTPPATAGAQSASGSFTPAISLAIVDVANGQTIASNVGTSITVTLPARAAGQPARQYRAVMKSGAMPALAPVSLGGAFGEYWLLNLMYTGTEPKEVGVHCISMIDTSWGPMCKYAQHHIRYSALDQATLSMSVSSHIQQNGGNVPYINSPLATNFAWDSGNDNLPGGH